MATVAVSDGDVILIVTFVALPIALIAFLGAGKALEQLGKGGLSLDRDSLDEADASPMEQRAIRSAELRQMLAAKSYRREQRGEAPLDVEAELQALTNPTAAALDPGLRREVREHVEASNARREARGKDPLDVDSEVERRLREMGAEPSGQRPVPSRPVSLSDIRDDPTLREEIRALVVAGNERRARRGQEPLDVEAEVERQLAELADS